MGIQEKKATRTVNEFLEAEGTPTLRTSSGNANLTCEFTAEEALEANQIKIAGDNLKEFITGFMTTCEDADYKEEIAKIEKIVVTAKAEIVKHTKPSLHGEIALDGNVMTIGLSGTYSLSGNYAPNVVEFIQSLY